MTSFDENAARSLEQAVIVEAILTVKSEFSTIDIFDVLRENGQAKNVTLDKVADYLEYFHQKGELEIVNPTPPKIYRKLI